jgi:hypothetical protein
MERMRVPCPEQDVREVASPDQAVGPEPVEDRLEEVVAVLVRVRPLREVVESGDLGENVRTVRQGENLLKGRGHRARPGIGVGQVIHDHRDRRG